MNFYSLQSVIRSTKTIFEMSRPMVESFSITKERGKPYIEPSFTKNEFAVEKPQVILVSAVGATGKSTLAQELSQRLSLPLLDFGKRKPIGDNTLTGLLTNAFSVEQLSPIFRAFPVDNMESSNIVMNELKNGVVHLLRARFITCRVMAESH